MLSPVLILYEARNTRTAHSDRSLHRSALVLVILCNKSFDNTVTKTLFYTLVNNVNVNNASHPVVQFSLRTGIF